MIHRVTMDIRILSILTTTGRIGIINLKKEITINGIVRNMVFKVYKIIDKMPLSGWGRK